MLACLGAQARQGSDAMDRGFVCVSHRGACIGPLVRAVELVPSLCSIASMLCRLTVEGQRFIDLALWYCAAAEKAWIG